MVAWSETLPPVAIEVAESVVATVVGQLTMIGTGPTDGLPSLLIVTEAELLTVPQVAGVVDEVMWTWTEAPGARSAGPKCRTPAVMVQVPVVVPASMLQLRPALVGRVSETATFRAVPAPVLVT